MLIKTEDDRTKGFYLCSAVFFCFYSAILLTPHEIQGGEKERKEKMLKKLCSHPGCYKVVEHGIKYCSRHKDTDREKYREYRRRRMKDEEEAKRQRFYSTPAWQHLRMKKEAQQFGIDIFEYYTTGRIIQAEQYHHIEEITEAWDKRLNENNIIGVSEANHRRIHKEYERSYTAKRKMQHALKEMMKRFEKDFADGGGI